MQIIEAHVLLLYLPTWLSPNMRILKSNHDDCSVARNRSTSVVINSTKCCFAKRSAGHSMAATSIEPCLNSAHSASDVDALCSRTQWCEVWVLNLSPVKRFCNLDAINEIKQVVGVTAQSALQAFGCTGSAAVVSLDWYIQDLLTECSWLLRMVTRLVQLKRPVYSWSDCHQV